MEYKNNAAEIIRNTYTRMTTDANADEVKTVATWLKAGNFADKTAAAIYKDRATELAKVLVLNGNTDAHEAQKAADALNEATQNWKAAEAAVHEAQKAAEAAKTNADKANAAAAKAEAEKTLAAAIAAKAEAEKTRSKFATAADVAAAAQKVVDFLNVSVLEYALNAPGCINTVLKSDAKHLKGRATSYHTKQDADNGLVGGRVGTISDTSAAKAVQELVYCFLNGCRYNADALNKATAKRIAKAEAEVAEAANKAAEAERLKQEAAEAAKAIEAAKTEAAA